MSAQWADKPIVLTGAAGMLGCELVPALGNRMGEAASKKLFCFDLDLDICDAPSVSAKLAELQPKTVINAAAYTDVDGCEFAEGQAMAVNATGAGNLARACRELGATLVHFSTDFVFDGGSQTPYRTDDKANPLSVYGQSKWAGERAIGETGCAHLIIRTSWLFGPHGKNFVEAILARARQGDSLSVVTDQVGCPTLASDLAEAVLCLLDVGATGTVHYCNAGPCSWHEFAVEIVRQAGIDVTVAPITSDVLDRPALRPACSVLDTTSYTSLTGNQPRSWRAALTGYFAERDAAHAARGDSPTRSIRSAP